MLLMLSHQEMSPSIKENLISDIDFCMNRRTSPSISIQEFLSIISDQCGHVRLTVFGVAVCWGSPRGPPQSVADLALLLLVRKVVLRHQMSILVIRRRLLTHSSTFVVLQSSHSTTGLQDVSFIHLTVWLLIEELWIQEKLNLLHGAVDWISAQF